MPEVRLDTAVLDGADFAALTTSLSRNGFTSRTFYYLDHAATTGTWTSPVLFLGAAYDPPQIAFLGISRD